MGTFSTKCNFRRNVAEASDTLQQANSVLFAYDSDGSISDLDLNDTVFEKSM